MLPLHVANIERNRSVHELGCSCIDRPVLHRTRQARFQARESPLQELCLANRDSRTVAKYRRRVNPESE